MGCRQAGSGATISSESCDTLSEPQTFVAVGRPPPKYLPDLAHWEAAQAIHLVAQRTEPSEALIKEAEAVVDGNPRADLPALMTKDTRRG
jgi:hypothetical protein